MELMGIDIWNEVLFPVESSFMKQDLHEIEVTWPTCLQFDTTFMVEVDYTGYLLKKNTDK